MVDISLLLYRRMENTFRLSDLRLRLAEQSFRRDMDDIVKRNVEEKVRQFNSARAKVRAHYGSTDKGA